MPSNITQWKRVALCDMTLKCRVRRHIFVCLSVASLLSTNWLDLLMVKKLRHITLFDVFQPHFPSCKFVWSCYQYNNLPEFVIIT